MQPRPSMHKPTLPKGDKPLCSGTAFGLSAAEQSALKR